MQTKTSLRGVKERNVIHRWLGGSILALTVFLFGFTIVPTLISEASAESVDIGAAWQVVSLTLDPDYEATQGGESASLSTHGNVNFGEIVPTTKTTGIANSSLGNVGTLKILKKTIRIDTTGQYYQVFLSMADDDSNALVNDTNSYISVPAITSDGTNSATYSSPAYFSAQGWGYAVTGNTGAITLPSFFANGDSTVSSSLNQELTYGNNETPYKSVKFAAVPLLSNPQPIYKNTTNIVGGFADNNADTFNVYYGVMINTDVLAGTYANQIVYTAMASASNLDSASENMAWESYIIAKDSEQEISFDLAASTIPSNISTANTHVYLVPHTEMLAAGTNGYDITALSGYANPVSTYAECEVSSITVGETKSTLTCTSPESPNGVIDNSGTDTNGKFDYWLHISGLNYNYVSKTIDDTEAVAYIGLQSTYQEENESTGELETKNYITEMQEMTGSICRNTNMWNNIAGDGARILDPTGTTGLVVDILDENDDVDETATIAANAILNIGTFKLYDNRDQHPYIVRRLADENCWMVENLDLNLAEVGILTPDDTDIVDSWNPYGKVAITEWGTWSLENLGQEQPEWEQYRSYSKPTYIWGSYYYDLDGEKTLGTTVNDNRYAEVPRSVYGQRYRYNSGTSNDGTTHTSGLDSEWKIENASTYQGSLYNWYAMTAESGVWDKTSSTLSEDAPYSICPKGWQLPEGPTSRNKSWGNLVKTVYNNATIPQIQKIPMSLSASGTVHLNGSAQFTSWGNFATRTYRDRKASYSQMYFNYNGTGKPETPVAMGKNNGGTVRCVARD